jgi:Pyruvate/2-oxoacid:ferredoxin oxidoreductase delta subunit
MKLFAPLDSEGNICGFDPAYAKHKYMYIWDIKNAVTDISNAFDSAVCVRECPKKVIEGVNGTNKEVFTIDCIKTKYLGAKNCSDAPLRYNSRSGK